MSSPITLKPFAPAATVAGAIAGDSTRSDEADEAATHVNARLHLVLPAGGIGKRLSPISTIARPNNTSH